jgi:hypothetical protein
MDVLMEMTILLILFIIMLLLWMTGFLVVTDFSVPIKVSEPL